MPWKVRKIWLQCRPPTRNVQLHLRRPQPVGVLHELVETLDLELDLEQPACCRRVQRDAVVAIVGADISGLTDPVAHKTREHGCPEPFVALDVRAADRHPVEAR